MSQQTCIIPEPAPHLASGKIKREFVLWENFTWLCLAKSNPQTPTTLRSWTKTVDKNCSKTNFWLESSRFPRLSRTVNLLSGLSGPGKCQNKIIGLSKFSRTNMNPDYTFYKAALVYMHNEIGMGLQFSTGVWSMSCSVNFFHLLLSQLGCLVLNTLLFWFPLQHLLKVLPFEIQLVQKSMCFWKAFTLVYSIYQGQCINPLTP